MQANKTGFIACFCCCCCCCSSYFGSVAVAVAVVVVVLFKKALFAVSTETGEPAGRSPGRMGHPALDRIEAPTDGYGIDPTHSVRTVRAAPKTEPDPKKNKKKDP